MMKTIAEIVEAVKAIQTKFGIALNSGIEKRDEERIKEEYQSFFESEIPVEYLELLKASNGLEFNGFRIYGLYPNANDLHENSIIYNNKTWYEVDWHKQYIFWGDSGQDFFVTNIKSGKFEVLDRYTGDGYSSFNSFHELFAEIKKLMLNE